MFFLYVCVSIFALQIRSSVPFLSIPHICVNIQCWFFSLWLLSVWQTLGPSRSLQKTQFWGTSFFVLWWFPLAHLRLSSSSNNLVVFSRVRLERFNQLALKSTAQKVNLTSPLQVTEPTPQHVHACGSETAKLVSLETLLSICSLIIYQVKVAINKITCDHLSESLPCHLGSSHTILPAR